MPGPLVLFRAAPDERQRLRRLRDRRPVSVVPEKLRRAGPVRRDGLAAEKRRGLRRDAPADRPEDHGAGAHEPRRGKRRIRPPRQR